ncbi:MAG TPA: HAMP domain-containing sensor histidine kinase [Thermoanaerobaculia bacterium]|nr:HAMP domain-containing sensor histidine kinase [Thermoanaerobaculia bacterium]
MTSRTTIAVSLLAAIAAATLLFWFFQHQLSSMWLDVLLRPEVREAIDRSAADQRKLYEADPAREAEYRARYEELRRLRARIDVLELSRREMTFRYELLLASVFAVMLLAGGIVAAVRARRNERRMAERLRYLEHLAMWQEAARRHAHEIKTPLTAARLEIERLVSQSVGGADEAELQKTQESISEELDRIARFTKEFSSFAAVGVPSVREEDLGVVVREFCTTFAGGWPNLRLRAEGESASRVKVDRDLLRRVFANLCSNAAHAVNGEGEVVFRVGRGVVEVRDDGGGINPGIQARLFEPYVTTRRIGEGMGLGLAISRKILLDHGGELELVDTSPDGTTFRITLPT